MPIYVRSFISSFFAFSFLHFPRAQQNILIHVIQFHRMSLALILSAVRHHTYLNIEFCETKAPFQTIKCTKLTCTTPFFVTIYKQETYPKEHK